MTYSIVDGSRCFIGVALFLFACGGTSAPRHGTLSDLSATTENPQLLCEHEVPADVCVRCNPELVERFQAANDWCGPHRVPESQCHRCHANLDFSPLPEIPAEADVRDLTHQEALEGLGEHVAEGKFTIFDFHADWCSACFNLDRRLREWLVESDLIAVRRIDVADWQGPVVDRYLRAVEMLPYVVILDAEGNEVTTMSNFDLDEFDETLQRILSE